MLSTGTHQAGTGAELAPFNINIEPGLARRNDCQHPYS